MGGPRRKDSPQAEAKGREVERWSTNMHLNTDTKIHMNADTKICTDTNTKVHMNTDIKIRTDTDTGEGIMKRGIDLEYDLYAYQLLTSRSYIFYILIFLLLYAH